jgi:hypothetical protein
MIFFFIFMRVLRTNNLLLSLKTPVGRSFKSIVLRHYCGILPEIFASFRKESCPDTFSVTQFLRMFAFDELRGKLQFRVKNSSADDASVTRWSRARHQVRVTARGAKRRYGGLVTKFVGSMHPGVRANVTYLQIVELL